VLLLVEMEALESGLTGDIYKWHLDLEREFMMDKAWLWAVGIYRSNHQLEGLNKWNWFYVKLYDHQRDLIKSRAQTRRGIFLGKFLNYSDVFRFMDSLSNLQKVCYKSERHVLFDRIGECFDEIEETLAPLADEVREAYAVVVAAVVLLSYVYLYLTGCGGWHGSRAVSSGSLDYRDTYIAIVLFRGAYVWIKFRDVASTKSKGVKLVTNGKYQLRFKPHRENGEEFDWIYIGRFDSQADADIVYRMIISCYGKDCGGLVDLAGDGRKLFPITPAFTLEEKRRVGKAKLDLVKKRVLEHYKRYKTEKDALNLPPTLPGASLEQELENRRLQSEILRERQQKEDLARQLQQYQSLLQAQMIQHQDLQHQVEGLQIEDLREPMTTAEIGSWMHELQGTDLQVQFQDPQAQQNLQQAQQFQIQNSELQVEDLQRPVQDQQIQQYLLHAQQ
jgi:hypothetical protein